MFAKLGRNSCPAAWNGGSDLRDQFLNQVLANHTFNSAASPISRWSVLLIPHGFFFTGSMAQIILLLVFLLFWLRIQISLRSVRAITTYHLLSIFQKIYCFFLSFSLVALWHEKKIFLFWLWLNTYFQTNNFNQKYLLGLPFTADDCIY